MVAGLTASGASKLRQGYIAQYPVPSAAVLARPLRGTLMASSTGQQIPYPPTCRTNNLETGLGPIAIRDKISMIWSWLVHATALAR